MPYFSALPIWGVASLIFYAGEEEIGRGPYTRRAIRVSIR
jgi:hypothetical protein